MTTSLVRRTTALVAMSALLCVPSSWADEQAYTLSASTTGSPVALVAGGWSGDGKEAQLDLNFLSVSPAARTRIVATWTSAPATAQAGFSTGATAVVEERGLASLTDRVTVLPALTDLKLESRQRFASGAWSRWSDNKTRSYNDLEQLEYTGAITAECIDVSRPTRYQVQFRLTASKGGTDASGLTLVVQRGGSGC